MRLLWALGFAIFGVLTLTRYAVLVNQNHVLVQFEYSTSFSSDLLAGLEKLSYWYARREGIFSNSDAEVLSISISIRSDVTIRANDTTTIYRSRGLLFQIYRSDPE